MIALSLVSSAFICAPETTAHKPKTSAFIPSDYDPAMYIYSESDFNSLGFPGNGSVSNPYVIAGVRISSAVTCITILAVSAHFVISNCSFFGTGDGIQLLMVENADIWNCTFSNEGVGVTATSSDNCSIQRITLYSQRSSIDLIFCTNFVISDINSNPAHSGASDVSLDACRNITMSSLLLGAGSDQSVSITSSSNITLVNSTSMAATTAYQVTVSSNVVVKNCNASSTQVGLALDGSSSCRFVNMLVNASQTGLEMVSATFVVVENCTFVGTASVSVQLRNSQQDSFANCNLGQGHIEIQGSTPEQWMFEFTNVTISGRPILYLNGLQESEYSLGNISEVIIVSCNGIRIAGANSDALVSLLCAFSQNCTLSATTISSIAAAQLLLYQCTNLRIENCSIGSGAGGEVRVQLSSSIRFANLTDYNASVFVWDSSSCQFELGKIDTPDTSMWLENATDVKISGFAMNSQEGYSLFLYQSTSCEMTDCNMTASVEIQAIDSSQYQHSFTNVRVNNRELGYFVNEDNLTLSTSKFSEVFMIGCRDAVIQGSNGSQVYGIELISSTNITTNGISFSPQSRVGMDVVSSGNVFLDESMLFRTMYLTDSTNISLAHCILLNCSFFAYQLRDISITESAFVFGDVRFNDCSGVSISNTNIHPSESPFTLDLIGNGIISDCRIENQRYYGVAGYGLTDCEFSNNQIMSKSSAFYFDIIERVTARNNSMSDCPYGLFISTARNSSFINNKIMNTSQAGILGNQMTGCIIRSNIITNSAGNGIYLMSSDSSVVALNVVSSNQGVGIYLRTTSDSLVWGNYLSNNAQNNAIDNGLNNHWNRSDSVGNYWSDLGNMSTKAISSDINSTDYYPLSIATEGGVLPALSSPPDMKLQYGYMREALHWIVWTDRPVQIRLLLGSSEVYREEINESTMITWDIGELMLGVTTYKLLVFAGSEMIASDNVTVEVLIPLNLVLTICAAIGVVCIVVILEKRKQNRQAGIAVPVEQQSPRDQTAT